LLVLEALTDVAIDVMVCPQEGGATMESLFSTMFFPDICVRDFPEKSLGHVSFSQPGGVLRAGFENFPENPCSEGILAETSGILTASPATPSCNSPRLTTCAACPEIRALRALELVSRLLSLRRSGPKSRKISGLIPKSSRYAETNGGDWCDHDFRPIMQSVGPDACEE
jgi:hypothetical protein